MLATHFNSLCNTKLANCVLTNIAITCKLMHGSCELKLCVHLAQGSGEKAAMASGNMRNKLSFLYFSIWPPLLYCLFPVP